MSALRLATENGKRIGRTSKAKRLAAGPATEAARLRRCLALIKTEAEKHQARADRIEATLRTLMDAAFSNNPILVRAMAREVSIEVPAAMSANLIVRFCEMAEEGTLCA